MALKEVMKLINTKAFYRVDSLLFEVVIKDAKEAYGNDLVLIVPVSGNGQKWVNVNSVKFVV